MGVCGGGVRGTLDTHSHLSKIHIECDAWMQSNDCRTTGRLVSPVKGLFAFINVSQDWTSHFGSHIKNLLLNKTLRSVSHELLLNQVSPIFPLLNTEHY